ncbi:MAG: hypothetical protein JWM00_242 [Candidatus Saccharibacteria bacterium]|nr:hypothetical protein [Candidatus Saccharibacteria bacterium]
MSEQLQKSVQKLRNAEAFADATNYPSTEVGSHAKGRHITEDGEHNFDEVQIDASAYRAIKGEKVDELKDAGLSKNNWAEDDQFPATSHDIEVLSGREFDSKHASEVGYKVEVIEPQSYDADTNKYESRPDMTYVDSGRVEVKRTARDKNGNVTEGVVKQLSGARAERASEILTNRAARLLGQSASKRVANLQEQYLGEDAKE